ncbi:hypothetical protein ACD578_25690 [Microvirga sp. RSM25]|uniref:hypothetical protein n=1 Tax=Microvirga sp. RSM25 TaxID=3273802 RepID=UPI00384AF86B
MDDAEALRLSLQLLRMKPEDLLRLINSAQGGEGESIARSTYTRWANGSTVVPAPVKALLRSKLLDLLKSRKIELSRRIVVAVIGKGGTGRSSNSMLLMAIARAMGIAAVYLDPTNGKLLSNGYHLHVAKEALPSQAIVVTSQREFRAAVEAACPNNGLVFIDCPTGLFLGLDEWKAFESDLLANVDHFVVTTNAGGTDMLLTPKITATLQECKASFRVLFCGQTPYVKLLAQNYLLFEKANVPVFDAYVTGSAASLRDRLMRYGKARNTDDFIEDDIPLLDAFTELLSEFDVDLEPPAVALSEESSFRDVVTAAAQAKGMIT